jgi:sortase A
MTIGRLAEQRLPAGRAGRQPHAHTRQLARALGATAAALGVLALVWVVVVWHWQDPLTALYTAHEQQRLASRYDKRLATYHPPASTGSTLAAERRAIALDARRYRLSLSPGDPVGRLRVPRLGLSTIVVNGTDESDLQKGPGRYLGSFVPGEGQLVYIAGHRTTYGAPFAHIDRLRPGDQITLELPYGTFVYKVWRHVIVTADDLSVLRSHGRELLALQACHPRFFATHRYIAYAVPMRVIPKAGRPHTVPTSNRHEGHVQVPPER